MTTSPALFTARALIDEFVRGGVRHFCVAPGSRSTALALAVAERSDISAHVLTDERSMGFFAVGIARAQGGPVALVCTSGTAVANLLPATLEAMLGGGALVLLTADRPPELRDAAAPQTIEQAGLFGSHVRWAADLPLLDPTLTSARVLRSIASRAVATARRGRGGPVHLNVPLREPFTDESFPAAENFRLAAREDGRPFSIGIGTANLSDNDIASLARTLSKARRGVIVCSGPQLPAENIAALACRLGWPVLADPLCGLRFGAHDRSQVVCAAEPLLRDEELRVKLRPDAILRFGLTPAPRSVQRWLEESWPAQHIVVSGAGHDEWPDPVRTASFVVHADEAAFCIAVTAALTGTMTAVKSTVYQHPTAGPNWLATWTRLSREARAAADSAIDADPTLFDGAIVRALAAMLPEGAALMIGNSMPVRDADAFLGASPKTLRTFASRGASGIDGVLSTAAGIAAATAASTTLLVGDLSFLHDAGALAFAERERLPLLIVVVNNDGGGIFSYLPLKPLMERTPGGNDVFERFFGTPHGADLGAIAEAAGCLYLHVDEKAALAAALAAGLEATARGPVVVEVRTDRDAARLAHQRAAAAAQAAARLTIDI